MPKTGERILLTTDGKAGFDELVAYALLVPSSRTDSAQRSLMLHR